MVLIVQLLLSLPKNCANGTHIQASLLEWNKSGN